MFLIEKIICNFEIRTDELKVQEAKFIPDWIFLERKNLESSYNLSPLLSAQ